jgi:cytochrome b6-f complex iron-sulfur subunit
MEEDRQSAPRATGPRKFGRRQILNWFLGTTIGALIASVLYPITRFISPPDIPESTTNQVQAGSVSDPDLLEKGFKIIRFGSEPVILIRVADDDFRAFSAVCTHLQCIVTFREKLDLIWCFCHNGVYDLTGKNIAGPPPRPLPPYKVHVVPGQSGQPAQLIVSKT